MEIIRLNNLEQIIMCLVGWLIMAVMYGLLGAEIAYTSMLPVIDGVDLAVALIAFMDAILSTVLFVMWTKGSYIE